jgi:signal transduction histidine kinase/ActR/RegA family two-component response regulator
MMVVGGIPTIRTTAIVTSTVASGIRSNAQRLRALVARIGVAASALLPRTLRAQFTLALCVLGALVVAGGATAVYALRETSEAARAFALERLEGMKSARDLMHHAQQIQWQTQRMLTSDSEAAARRFYAQVQVELAALDVVTTRLAISEDAAVLDLHHASQLFGNSAHIVAALHESALLPGGKTEARTAAIERAREEMQLDANALLAAARAQSDRTADALEEAANRMVGTARRNALFVATWLACSLIIAWLIARRLLGRHVLARLQEISRQLRLPSDAPGEVPRLPVRGNDEIGAMARAVEQFLTDRRELASARARLEESQQRLQAIIDNTADGILALRGGKVVQANPAAERLFGAAPSTLVGAAATALLPDFDGGGRMPFGVTCDALARMADGRSLPVELSLSRVSARTGDLLVLVIRDATLRREAQRHLVEARDAAEAARATQAAFLANMSHELRTPLNGVLGYAQLLQMQSPLSERQTFAVNTIIASGRHLLALISDLLDLASHDAGRLELFVEECSFGDCLRVTADIVRVKAEEARIEFRCEVASDVPPRVVADERRLRQVLLNLLSNAVKFTERGEVVLSVSVVERSAGVARVRFVVRDSGVGMQPNEIEALFQPFSQVGDRRRRAGGSGLGLAISRELVRLMGGDIAVQSAPGRGSSFQFDLDLTTAPSGCSVATPAVVGFDGPRQSILVVGDLAANRCVVSGLLGPLGFEIVEASDGRQALGRMREHVPDLVLMDLAMPVLDGARTIEAMRADAALCRVPVIAMSANGSAASGDLGADGFLSKPVDREQLLKEIGRCLSLRWRMEPPVPPEGRLGTEDARA